MPEDASDTTGSPGATRSPAERVAHAQRIVEARLGRPPQDMLEAAVVLEAWGGMPTREALAVGELLMTERPQVRPAAARRFPEDEPARPYTFESVAFAAAVLAIVCWTTPLAQRVSSGSLHRALVVALPGALMLQWWLRSRYLGRPGGVTLLRRPAWAVPVAALALVGLPTALLGSAGVVGGLLALVWSGGTILVARRWSDGYVGLILLATVAMVAGLDALWTLGAVAIATALGVVAAVRLPPAGGAGVRAGQWGRALTAAAIGGAIGVILVADDTAGWGDAAVPALSLLPSAIASVWAGYSLWRFPDVIRESVSGVSVEQPDPPGPGPALGILLAATARLVSLTVALSALLLLAAPPAGVGVSAVGVLVGFGLVALATLFLSLLEALARPALPLLALVLAIAAEVVTQRLDLIGVAGGGLVVGAGVVVLLTVPPAVVLMSRPATTLATSLWVP